MNLECMHCTRKIPAYYIIGIDSKHLATNCPSCGVTFHKKPINELAIPSIYSEAMQVKLGMKQGKAEKNKNPAVVKKYIQEQLF